MHPKRKVAKTKLPGKAKTPAPRTQPQAAVRKPARKGRPKKRVTAAKSKSKNSVQTKPATPVKKQTAKKPAPKKPEPKKPEPKKPQVIYLDDPTSSESSSSEEDSEDEFILGSSGPASSSARKRQYSASSSSSEGDSDSDGDLFIENDDIATNRKRKNTRKKKNKRTENFDDDIQIVDDIHSIRAKLRAERMEKRKRGEELGEDELNDEEEDLRLDAIKVRKQRRRSRIIRPIAEPRRRRIKRSNMDLTVPYTSGTFVEYIPVVTNLLSDIEDDPEVDHRRLELLENGLSDNEEIKDVKTVEEEEPKQTNQQKDKKPFGPKPKPMEVDPEEIYLQLQKKERQKIAEQTVEQVTELQHNPFAEKLAGYIPHPSISGNYRSLVQSYHPDMFKDDRYFEAPSILVWNRPFDHLIHQPKYVDIDRDPKKYVEAAITARKRLREDAMRYELRKRVAEIRNKPVMTAAIADKKPSAARNLFSSYQSDPFFGMMPLPLKSAKLEHLYMENTEPEEAQSGQQMWMVDEMDDIQVIN